MLQLFHLMICVSVTCAIRATYLIVFQYFCPGSVDIFPVEFFIVDSPIQCASFYVERIDLASKLRKFLPKWR